MDEEWIEAYELAWDHEYRDLIARMSCVVPTNGEVLRDLGLLLLFVIALYGALNRGYPTPTW